MSDSPPPIPPTQPTPTSSEPTPVRPAGARSHLGWSIGLIAAGLLMHGRGKDFFYYAGALMIGLPVLVCAALAYQAVVKRCVRRWLNDHPAWTALMLLPCLLFAGHAAWTLTPRGAAAETLDRGRLASLPFSATDIRSHSWQGLLSGEYYVRFRAPVADVEEFLKNSPGLRGAEVKHYSPERQRRLMHDGPLPSDGPDLRHEYHHESHPVDWWWNGELLQKGRVYSIPADEDGAHHWGRVIYDEASGVVFINVTFS